MRRALLVAVLAMPAIAGAQTPTAGTIIFTEGTSDLVHGPWISLAECVDGSADVSVSWSTRLLSGVPTVPVDAVSQLYASNTPATGDACRRWDDASTGVKAGPAGAAVWGAGQVVTLQPFWIGEILSGAGIADRAGCSAVSGDTPVYLCVQTYSADTTPIGIATGTMVLSVSAPAAPTAASVSPADGALQVAWGAPVGSPAAYDYRVVAVADPPDARDPIVHEVTDVRALSYVMNGLVNDVPYGVQVYARSQAGNESAPSARVTGTPAPTPSSWGPFLPPHGGTGQGGCGAGGAGPVALLGVAALLARLLAGRHLGAR